MAEIVLTDKDINQFGFQICGSAFATSLEYQKADPTGAATSGSGTNSGVEFKEAGNGVYDTKKIYTPNMVVAGLRAFDMDERKIDDNTQEKNTDGTEHAD